MENQNSFDLLVQQSLLTQRVQLLNLQIQLGAFQKQVFKGNCGGNHFHGVGGTMEGGYCYQPQFEYAPRSDFYCQSNTYLPTTMEYPDFSYGSSYLPHPDSSQFLPIPLDDGSQDFYQPYVDETPCSQEVWQQSQDISPSFESVLMAFIQESQNTFKANEASLRNLENQIGQIALQLSEGPIGILPNHEIMSPMEQYTPLTISDMTSSTMKESLELEETHDVEEFIEMLKALEPLVEDVPKKNDIASLNHLIVDGGSERVKEMVTNLDAKPIFSCFYSNPVFEDDTQEIEESITTLDARPIVPCLYSNPLFEDGPSYILQSHEVHFKKQVEEFEESQHEEKYIVELEARPINSCVLSKSYFEDSANYILQPQGLHPILKEIAYKETTTVPFDHSLVSIPWDPGGSFYDKCNKVLAFNFKYP